MNRILILSFIVTAVAFSLAVGKRLPGLFDATDVNPDSKPDTPAVTIIENTHTLLPNGGYKFGHKTSDGQEREETGEFNENGIWVVKGSYSFIGSDNKKYIVTYVADDKGYNAETKSA